MDEQKPYIIISAIFDINRINKSFKKRSLQSYILLFKWINELNLPTILYTETHIIDKIDNRDDLIIIDQKIEELPNYKKLINLNPTIPTNCKHLNKEYSAVITSKFHLLNISKQYILENKKEWIDYHLIWLDAGIAHVCTIPKLKFINDIQLHIHNKISIVMMKATSNNEISDINIFLSINCGKIAAGIIICPWLEIQWIHDKINKLYDTTLNDLNKICLEEQFMAIITTNNKDRFKFIYSDYWMLPNLKYITCNINTVIDNLKYCRINNIRDIGMELLDILLLSIKDAKYNIDSTQLCKLLYNGQILSYYVNKKLCKDLGLLIQYLYHNSSKCHEILSKYNNLSSNLIYVNIDINICDNNILNTDLARYIWTEL
uniref:Uncharacterized protein n=1 Tax=Pithovirus LCPAC102 TaxID=2506587 RepID=A0A4D5XFV3_9VIRU|nr:MAG: hypothetical protein LCPAC102_02000 [Pithovirus LCPAC102]